MPQDAAGWEQYSRLVLQQLESLSTGIEALRQELQDVKNQLTELKAREDRVQDIKVWKREQKRNKKEKRDGSNEKQYIRMA